MHRCTHVWSSSGELGGMAVHSEAMQLPIAPSRMLLLQSMRNTQRALKTGHVAMIQQLEQAQPVNTETILPHIMGTVGRKAYETGDVEKAMLSCGQGVVFADKIEPLSAIVDRIEAEACAAMTRLNTLYRTST